MALVRRVTGNRQSSVPADGLAMNATFASITGTCYDSVTQIMYIVDKNAAQVRALKNGIVTTLANGTYLDSPDNCAVGSSVIFVHDRTLIRMINKQTGIVSTMSDSYTTFSNYFADIVCLNERLYLLDVNTDVNSGTMIGSSTVYVLNVADVAHPVLLSSYVGHDSRPLHIAASTDGALYTAFYDGLTNKYRIEMLDTKIAGDTSQTTEKVYESAAGDDVSGIFTNGNSLWIMQENLDATIISYISNAAAHAQFYVPDSTDCYLLDGTLAAACNIRVRVYNGTAYMSRGNVLYDIPLGDAAPPIPVAPAAPGFPNSPPYPTIKQPAFTNVSRIATMRTFTYASPTTGKNTPMTVQLNSIFGDPRVDGQNGAISVRPKYTGSFTVDIRSFYGDIIATVSTAKVINISATITRCVELKNPHIMLYVMYNIYYVIYKIGRASCRERVSSPV